MSLLAEDKSIKVRCERTAGVAVKGDRARMKQVIVNLLDNAIKYTPKGGHVRIGVQHTDAHAVLEVSDDGIGIPPEAAPRYLRGSLSGRSTLADQGGAGLGLSIVEAICLAHGAEVELMSMPGKGTCFRIRQPLA